MKRKFYIFMAVLSGLVFGLSVFYYLQNIPVPPSTQTKPLVIAATDLPARSILQKNQLKVKDIPIDGYPQGGASTLEEVAGKVLLVHLTKDDVVLSPVLQSVPANDAAPKIVSDQFSLAVPRDMRAVAVPVSLAGSVNHKVGPGDRVDILITMDIKNENDDTLTITSLAAQDVLVLNTGDNANTDSDKIQASSSYILALTVPQAMAITLGSERGSIRLILRNPVNQEIFTEKPMDPSAFLRPDYFIHYQ